MKDKRRNITLEEYHMYIEEAGKNALDEICKVGEKRLGKVSVEQRAKFIVIAFSSGLTDFLFSFYEQEDAKRILETISDYKL